MALSEPKTMRNRMCRWSFQGPLAAGQWLVGRMSLSLALSLAAWTSAAAAPLSHLPLEAPGTAPTSSLAAATKKLIEFGWDEPDTRFLREHLAEMEKLPLDGCVFHVSYPAADGKQGSFTWEAWGDRVFSEAELQAAREDLEKLAPTRFKHNFLRFNTTPAKLDWFDDYRAVVHNAQLAARLAQAGKCPGVLFDIEQYEGALFDYRKQRSANEKPWEVYSAQARQRGREVMQAFENGFPGLKVFLTFGYSLPWSESQGGKKSLADCHYGLLAPFLDGMVQAASGSTRLVDGYEISYGYRDVTRFEPAYQTMQARLLPIVGDPDKYRRVFSFAFGIWLDHDWRKSGWNVEDLSKNFYTPEGFERSVRQALAVSDEYVWVYAETPRWWSATDGPERLPAAYIEAVRLARQATPP
jgi:hypothetical protein